MSSVPTQSLKLVVPDFPKQIHRLRVTLQTPRSALLASAACCKVRHQSFIAEASRCISSLGIDHEMSPVLRKLEFA